MKEGTCEENWKEFEAIKESLSSNWEDVTRNRTHHMHLIKEWNSCETHTRTTLKKAQSPSGCCGDRHKGKLGVEEVVKGEGEGGQKNGQEFLEGIGVVWGGGWVLW